MKVKAFKGGVDYKSPVCTPVEVSSEGILCASVYHEAYDPDNITNYGSGVENKGWN